jgi:outer membrane protein
MLTVPGCSGNLHKTNFAQFFTDFRPLRTSEEKLPVQYREETGMRPPIPVLTTIAALSLLLSVGASAQLSKEHTNPAQKVDQIDTAPTTKPGSNPPPQTVTLDQAVAIALHNSKALRIANESINRARGRVDEQRAGFNPSLGATTTITHLDTSSSFALKDANGNTQAVIPIVKQDQRQIGVNATLPLDFAGLIRAAVQQSQFQEIVSRLDYNRTRNQTVLDVKNAYYDVLRAKAFVGVQETALQNTKDRQTTAELNLRVGTGTRFDVLRAQTDVANADQNLIIAKNRVNLTTATLNNVLGLDQNTPLQTVEAAEAPQPEQDFSTDVAEAYKKRPEVLQAEANISANEKGIQLAQRSLFPTVGLSAGYNFTPDQGGFAPKTTSWAAVATIQLPIFDQGLSRARVRQARTDVNTAKINKQVTQDGVALDVRQNYLALLEAQDRLGVTQAALAQAVEQYRLAQVRFKAGVTAAPGASPLLEISDAQNALTQAQNNEVNAKYDVQNSKARLDRAIGRYGYDGTANPGLPAPDPKLIK